LRVGVLALQGDFREHQLLLEQLGADVTAVKSANQLDNIAGLVIPGGESTAISKLLTNFGLLEPIRAFQRSGGVILGTCAGMILLSEHVEGAVAGQQFIGGLDISVSRNAYGSQNQSFEADVELSGALERVAFIRAPRILSVGPRVTVLATNNGEPIAVSQDNLFAASFHPELTGVTALHTLFLQACERRATAAPIVR
jgi:5'-phosphate synthase pdxT subunit